MILSRAQKHMACQMAPLYLHGIDQAIFFSSWLLSADLISLLRVIVTFGQTSQCLEAPDGRSLCPADLKEEGAYTAHQTQIVAGALPV